ncbi:LuxR C-terminal-related transcriptional regulator, partial [Chloroflexota bacterium]
CQEAFEYLPENDLIVHCMLAFHLGIAHAIRGELTSASYYLAEANTYGQRAGNFYIALIAMGCMAEIQAKHGHLHRAAQTNHQALELGIEKGGGGSLPATSLARVNLARIHYRWNDLDTAIYYATNGVELAEQAGESITLLMSCLTLARVYWARGQMEAMNKTLDRARQITSSSNNAMVTIIADAWVARLSLAQGDSTVAERWVANLHINLNLHEIPDFWSELPYLTFVRLMIVKGELEEVPEALERLSQRSMSEGQMETVIEVLTLQSIALHALRKEGQALSVLKKALSLAEPEEYVRLFIDEGDPMKHLLQIAADRGIAPKYVSQLLSAMESDVVRKTLVPSGLSPVHDLPEPLTERELEVLRFVAGAMSNYEIAKMLVIEENTVKSHMNHIFGKLQAKNRLQAVEKARALGLL